MNNIHFQSVENPITVNSPVIYSNDNLFKGIKLYPYQQCVVNRMLENEIEKFNVSKTDLINYNNIEVYKKSVKLSLKLGTGKTIMILAVILINRPTWRKYLFETGDINAYNLHPYFDDNRPAIIKEPLVFKKDFAEDVYMPMVEKTMKRIRINIVMCQKTIINQWEKCINEFTDLNFLAIKDAKTLQSFIDILYSCIENNNMSYIERYDILLVNINSVTIKNINFYNITSNINFLGINTSTIPEVLSEVLFNYCVDRIFIDDYDMQYQGKNQILKDFNNIYSKYYYYVSSTNNDNCTEQLKNRKYLYNYDRAPFINNLINIGANNNLGVFKNKFLNATRIICEDNFINQTINVPLVVEKKHIITNKDKKLFKAINNIGDENAPELIRLFHEGAYGDISGILKTDCKSPADIFKKTLGNKYNEFIYAKLYFNYLTLIKTLSILPDVENIYTNVKLCHVNISAVKKYYRNVLNLININNIENYVKTHFIEAPISEEFNLFIEEANNNMNEIRSVIDKIKTNIMDTDFCAICAIDTKEEKKDIGLFCNCCNFACCMDCIKAIHLTRKCKCPQCHSAFTIKDIIVIGSEVLNKFEEDGNFIENNFTEIDNTKSIEEEQKNINNILNKKIDKKEDMLMFYAYKTLKNKISSIFIIDEMNDDNEDLYENRLQNYLGQFKDKGPLKPMEVFNEIPEAINITSNIGGLMQNKDNIGIIPKDGEYKLIVFASHDETLERSERALKKYGIPYLRICGTYKQIGAQVKMFDNNLVNILTVNNTKYSSGLHLISANHVIMLHDIKNAAEKSQLCGRIVRIGQKWQPNIVTILYDTEDKD